jgi:two-component system, OmpR family, sensor histidine kinase KdpD
MPAEVHLDAVFGTRPWKGAAGVRRTVWGGAAALIALAACAAILLAFRPHLSVATAALVLVVPVLIGVSIGGFTAGVAAALVGFLVFDWFFVPPFGTLTVGHAQDWVALGVYLVVVLIVTRMVAIQQDARRLAATREAGARALNRLSGHLIGERPLDELLALVVTTVGETFATRWVAVLLPVAGVLTIAATAGEPLSDEERALALGADGAAQSMTLVGAPGDVSRIALTVVQRPVGQLVVGGARLDAFSRELLGTFANQAALAIERSRLREQVLRTELLEEVDRWRSALVGAVSHDLRTPLASIKAAVTTLSDAPLALSAKDQRELLGTIDEQCDHLTRLVANLLDMARLETGSLTLRSEPRTVAEIIDAAVTAVGTALSGHRLEVRADESLPLVEVDLVLIAQVVANLLSNAAQHSPEGSTVTVSAREEGCEVVVTVSDEGPGVREEDRERIFHMLDRHAGSGRAGLGLAISTAFVDAHGQRLTVADAPGGGASFTFRVRIADLDGVPA